MTEAWGISTLELSTPESVTCMQRDTARVRGRFEQQKIYESVVRWKCSGAVWPQGPASTFGHRRCS